MLHSRLPGLLDDLLFALRLTQNMQCFVLSQSDIFVRMSGILKRRLDWMSWYLLTAS